MFKLIKRLIILFFLLSLANYSSAKEDFFTDAKIKFDLKKINDSKFLLQRNIAYNPKHAKSYLYLAKIYNLEENDTEEEKNLNTTLLLEPDNEEAIYMLIDIKLEKSDISKVEDLKEKFKIICNSLCSKIESIDERLSNINAKN